VRRGLADPVADSQAIFRAVLEAMARPGRLCELPRTIDAPGPLHPATAAVCLTLTDFETPLWLDPAARTGEVVEYLRFHCGAPIVEAPADASFAVVLGDASAPGLEAFAWGTDEEPERSATVIVQVDALAAGRGHRLTGPGIAHEARLCAKGLPPAFWACVQHNHAAFPRGVDIILVSGSMLAALPRTTRVEVG
jgi:alpha-D-ribose 1-methylphosphonate 5-triphosphate synthase subunit PhnH